MKARRMMAWFPMTAIVCACTIGCDPPPKEQSAEIKAAMRNNAIANDEWFLPEVSVVPKQVAIEDLKHRRDILVRVPAQWPEPVKSEVVMIELDKPRPSARITFRKGDKTWRVVYGPTTPKQDRVESAHDAEEINGAHLYYFDEIMAGTGRGYYWHADKYNVYVELKSANQSKGTLKQLMIELVKSYSATTG